VGSSPGTVLTSIRRNLTFLPRQLLFGFFKLLPPTKTVVFLSYRSQELLGSLKLLHAQAQTYPRWTVIAHTKDPLRGFMGTVRIYHDCARAQVVFLDDYTYTLRGLKPRKNSQIVQVWHAAGAFKKFGLSALGSSDSNSKRWERSNHSSYTAVIASSSQVRHHYAEAFGVPVEAVLPLGVPATDVLSDADHCQRVRGELLQKYPSLAGKQILLYAPTFRGGPSQRTQFTCELDLSMMKEQLGQDFQLVVKLHPAVSQSWEVPTDLQDFVLDLSHEDIHELLILADRLITDYSSVIFDYSLLGRPMFFFAYDLESYESERGFYEPYETFVPGPVVSTTAELVATLQQGNGDAKRIRTFADRFFDHLEGASKRILDHFLGEQGGTS